MILLSRHKQNDVMKALLARVDVFTESFDTVEYIDLNQTIWMTTYVHQMAWIFMIF